MHTANCTGNHQDSDEDKESYAGYLKPVFKQPRSIGEFCNFSVCMILVAFAAMTVGQALMNWAGGLALASGLKIVGHGVSFLDQIGVGLDNSVRRNQIEQGEWVVDRAAEMMYRHLWCKAANTENCGE